MQAIVFNFLYRRPWGSGKRPAANSFRYGSGRADAGGQGLPRAAAPSPGIGGCGTAARDLLESPGPAISAGIPSRMTMSARLHRLLYALACVLAGLYTLAARAEPATVDARAIAALVEHSVLAQLRDAPLARGAARVEVAAGALDTRLTMAACGQPIRVAADLSRQQARVNARVSCSAPSPWNLYVPVEIRVYRPVLVATRELRRGEPIGAADVALEERNVLAAAGAPPLTQAADVVGLNARRTIAPGTLLSAGLVELPVLVRRGDRLGVSARSGGITVQINGEALGTARLGERVRVRNLQSGRVIDAVVTGSGSAEAI